MTIVHCIFTMETGGAQMLAIDILNGLVPQHEAHLVIVNNKWHQSNLDQLDPRVHLHFIGRKEGSKNPLPYIKFNRLLTKLKPDVVHCHETKMATLLWRPKFPLLLTVHNTGYPAVYAESYDQLVAISHSVALDVNNRFDLDIPVVNNGVAISTFERKTDYTIANQDPMRLVQVSRLVLPTKGQDLLLKAVAAYRAKDPHVKLEVTFVGDGRDKSELEELTHELGLDTQVTFLGRVDRSWIKTNLKDYHVLLQPSTLEGFGLTVVEGAAAGLPIVASRLDGPEEILGSSPEGLLFEVGDVHGLVQCLQFWYNAYRKGGVADILSSPLADVRARYNITSTIEGYLHQYELLKVSHAGSVRQ